MTWFQTTNGHIFSFEDLRSNTYDIEEIAKVLGRINRFNGHSKQPWTVLQHSFLCERLAELRGHTAQDRLNALMHDAHEAYVGDMMSPLKYFCPGFKAVEKKVQKHVAEVFGLTDNAREIDLRALAIEKHHLFGESPPGYRWEGLPEINLKRELDSFSEFLTVHRELFLRKLETLRKEIGRGSDAHC